MSAIRLIALNDLDAGQRAALTRRTQDDMSSYREAVLPIIEAVRERGDAALAEFAKRFDRADVAADAIAAAPGEFDRAEARLDGDLKHAMREAAANIRRFHETQMPERLAMVEMAPGIRAGDRTLPIPSVAAYVPRGKGAFPSVALMTTIPAVVAGVGEIIVLTPPTPDGGIDDATLFACRLAGVSKVYRCGGAQAVAAAAYGTRTVPKVSKFLGPGSPWVVAAMQVLSDVIDVGPPAGPSESIVLAEGGSNARNVALDLLNEAEHGPDSSAWLVTDDMGFAEAVRGEVETLLGRMGEERAGYARSVLSGDGGGLLVAPDMDAACAFCNDYAPEHLMVHAADPRAYLDRLTHAGEILLGGWSAISIANYVLGPNHVLPTTGWAKTRSALSVHDFLKRQTIAELDRRGYEALAPLARVFARYEGFEAHANAVSELRETD
ncbi:MAG: histidinol dehydrogenase [Flavobacteriaceae bacterium]